jgi:hypothetical protein
MIILLIIFCISFFSLKDFFLSFWNSKIDFFCNGSGYRMMQQQTQPPIPQGRTQPLIPKGSYTNHRDWVTSVAATNDNVVSVSRGCIFFCIFF